MTKTLDEALQELKREPGLPVRATVEGVTVEVRVVADLPVNRSAAALFAEIGPWEGETTDEMLEFLAEARRHGSQRSGTGSSALDGAGSPSL